VFEHNSRYAPLQTATLALPDGRQVTYALRRFLPSGKDLPTLARLTVAQGDRLDLITARTLGDPEQSWRVCDANDALDPTDLTAEPGATVRIAAPQR